MKILFIAPLPPPVTGHSLVSHAFYSNLIPDIEVNVVDLSKSSTTGLFASLKRIFEVVRILNEVRRKKNGVKVIYLTLSESLLGNIKDLLIFLICYRQLSEMFVHLHGGSIKRLLWDKSVLIYAINKFFVSRLGGVFISGPSHSKIFHAILPPEKIFIVPNFAHEKLFLSTEKISQKYHNCSNLKILYLSSMRKMKGYEELLNGYLKLGTADKEKLIIDFAGSFESKNLEDEFVSRISSEKNITYHGNVNEEKKLSLFAEAHVFCLPTLHFEGQPVCILEAYASGCMVMTTGQSGILDIFSEEENGKFISLTSLHDSIAENLKYFLKLKDTERLRIALNNNETAARKYRISSYNSALRKVMNI